MSSEGAREYDVETIALANEAFHRWEAWDYAAARPLLEAACARGYVGHYHRLAILLLDDAEPRRAMCLLLQAALQGALEPELEVDAWTPALRRAEQAARHLPDDVATWTLGGGLSGPLERIVCRLESHVLLHPLLKTVKDP